MRIFCVLCLVALTTGQGSRKEDCEKDDPFVFYRTFAIKGEVPASAGYNISKTEMMKVFGPCDVDLDDFAEEMARYMESFGFDARGFRRDPFSPYTDDIFTVETQVVNNVRIKAATLFDFSKFLNTKLYAAGWRLWTKSDSRGVNNKTIPARSSLRFGFQRFWMHGRYFCSKVTSVSPEPNTARFLPQEYKIESPEWGIGVTRGLVTYLEDKGYWDIRSIMTFPGDV